MKRVLFSIAAIALIANVNAQNLNKVKDALEEKNLMVAKQEIDGLVAIQIFQILQHLKL
jgi:hypothetical protein